MGRANLVQYGRLSALEADYTPDTILTGRISELSSLLNIPPRRPLDKEGLLGLDDGQEYILVLWRLDSDDDKVDVGVVGDLGGIAMVRLDGV